MAKLSVSRRPRALIFLMAVGASLPGQAALAQSAPALRIDVPVMLQRGDVVVDVGHAVHNGEGLFLVGDINLLITDYVDWKTKGRIVAVFHGDAAYLVLNDAAYNAAHHVTTGNPYAATLSEWMSRGAQVELCGATAQANHWGNGDLLPGVKVNTNAMVRVTQLERQGYTLIYE